MPAAYVPGTAAAVAVIVEVPAPMTVTSPVAESIVATLVLLLVQEIAPPPTGAAPPVVVTLAPKIKLISP